MFWVMIEMAGGAGRGDWFGNRQALAEFRLCYAIEEEREGKKTMAKNMHYEMFTSRGALSSKGFPDQDREVYLPQPFEKQSHFVLGRG